MTVIGRHELVDTSPQVPRILWANGLVQQAVRKVSPARPSYSGGAASQSPDGHHRWVGWYVQQFSFPSFDQFAYERDLPTVRLRHRLKGGGTTDVDHWSLSQIIRFAPLTAGPPVPHALMILSNPDYCAETIRAGIGIRSETGEQGRVRVRLAMWGMLSVLVQDRWVAYESPVQISVGGLMAQSMLDALVTHYHVCTQADVVWGRRVGYYELYLPLGPLQEQQWSTRDGYSVTVVPLGSHHPPLDQVDATYLRSVAFPWNEQGGEETVRQLWESVQQWAAWFSRRGGVR